MLPRPRRPVGGDTHRVALAHSCSWIPSASSRPKNLAPLRDLVVSGMMWAVMHDGQVEVPGAALAAAAAAQFPELAGVDVVPVQSAGTVVAPFRVGAALLARVPLVPVRGASVTDALEAADQHARALRAHLSLAVPQLFGVGRPFAGYDGVWSLWTWLDGQSLDRVLDENPTLCDLDTLAVDLGRVLKAHQSLPAGGASWSGNGRGGKPLTDTDWVRTSIQRCAHLIDPGAATRVWESALDAPAHEGGPVSINGDPMPGNFIIKKGRLSGMIDISAPVVGDPAADLQPAWVAFDEPQRSAFKDAMGLDDAAWRRGRGWAFEMAIGGLHYYEHTNPLFFRLARHTLHRLSETA